MFLSGLYHAEQNIADALCLIWRRHSALGRIDADKALPWVEGRTGLTLAESQRTPFGWRSASKLLVITGGPGVGKTTLVNSILQILAAKGLKLAAGRPDRPSRQAPDRKHRPGGQDDPPPARGRSRPWRLQAERGCSPLDCDLLVIDETLDGRRAADDALLRAVPSEAAVLMVGDVDQLPSVGPGRCWPM